jgi:hypothetical protein
VAVEFQPEHIPRAYARKTRKGSSSTQGTCDEKIEREAGYWKSDRSPWAYGGSRKYLWTDADLNSTIAYVEYEQGDE